MRRALAALLAGAVLFAACGGSTTTTPGPDGLTPRPRPDRSPTAEATDTREPVEIDLPIAVVDTVPVPKELANALDDLADLVPFDSYDEALEAYDSEDAAFVVAPVEPGEDPPDSSDVLLSSAEALLVPFTFPLESVSAADAAALAAGDVDSWDSVGGPALEVVAEDDPAAVEPGDVLVEPWTGPRRELKPLRVDGRLPDAAGYELAERWVAVGAPEGTLDALPAPDSRDYVTIAAVGDMMFARTVGDAIAEDGPDYPFEEVADLLGDADITFGNLECVLSDNGEPAPKGFTFAGDPAVVGGLLDAGFDVVSLANNHTLDYGRTALHETLDSLDDAGLDAVGAGDNALAAHEPVVVSAGGLDIAFLAYGAFFEEASFPRSEQEAGVDTPGIAWGDPEVIASEVEAAASEADVVIVSLHSGFEYTSALSDAQVTAAYAAIDAGADAVLGSGPHVLQGMEYYNGGFIAWSLGNFIFDFDEQDRAVPGMPSQFSGVLTLAVDADGVRGVTFEPLIIDENRPRPAGEDAQAVFDWFYPLVDEIQ